MPRRELLTSLVLAAALCACGGARSAGGTSAANCVRPLEAALVHAPAKAHFRGLAEVPGRAGPTLGVPRSRAPYCVVLFEVPGPSAHLVREVYRLGATRPLTRRELPLRRLRPPDLA